MYDEGENVIELASGSPKGLTINEWLKQQRVCGIEQRVQVREAECTFIELAHNLQEMMTLCIW